MSVSRSLVVFVLVLLSAASVAAEKFSVVLIPDPQMFTILPEYDMYRKQTRWIAENTAKRNIKHTIFLGDLTGNNQPDQWKIADAAFKILDDANCPYSVITGNHDSLSYPEASHKGVVDRNLDNFNATLGPKRFAGKPWYGGNFGNTPDRNENSYCFFSSGELKFMVVNLELAPRKEVLTWANNLISRHPDHRVIISTHSYIGPDTDYNDTIRTVTGIVGAGGSQMFWGCVSRHSNVFMVVCGHVGESALSTRKGEAGNTIYEMVVDYQFERPLGVEKTTPLGNGWLRVLEFDPDHDRIDASTLSVTSGDPTIFKDGIDRLYEPFYSPDPNHADHKFTMNYNMHEMVPYSYKNGSTGFSDMAVNNAPEEGDQLNPDVAQAANGDWAGVYEDAGAIMVRGFDADGNERFGSRVVSTTGTATAKARNPAIAMCRDGRFAVAYEKTSDTIAVRTYDTSGTPSSAAEQVVASKAGARLRNPDVAIDDKGNFVIVWEDDSDGDGVFQIMSRAFQFDSTPRAEVKAVNSRSAGQHVNPSVAMTPGGDYVVVWDHALKNDGNIEIKARGFSCDGQERFAEMVANKTVEGPQSNADVGADAAGRFVVVWQDDSALSGTWDIRARAFGADGLEILPEIKVNQELSGNQGKPAVAMDAEGKWAVAWEDDGSTEGSRIMSQKFTLDGDRGSERDVRVNSVGKPTRREGDPRRRDPAISVHESGRYLAAWADDADGDGTFEVLARAIGGKTRELMSGNVRK